MPLPYLRIFWQMNELAGNGKLVVFCAPSGAGKTTLVRHLLQCRPVLAFSVSATTRKPREGELHGRDYYFLSELEFDRLIDEGAFLEWEEVYAGTRYGTLRSEIERLFAAGKHVMFDVDVQGALHIKQAWHGQCLTVFVKPPSVQALEERLRSRGTDTEEKIVQRVAKAVYEMAFESRFDVVLLNDELERAKKEATDVVDGFIGG